MKLFHIFIILFIHLIKYDAVTAINTSLKSKQSLNYYIGAVAEHQTFLGDEDTIDSSPELLLDMNLALYEDLIALAARNKAQVIVFPEFGLTATTESTRESLYPFTEIIPNVAEDPYESPISPCNTPDDYETRPILLRMSCAALKNEILVLVNTIDWVPCNKTIDEACPSDSHYQYNTDVLFDERGILVAKYHKSHEWPGFTSAYDQAPEPTRVTFESSFGVEFGLFICFDIVFPDPAVVLVENGVKHFLYAVKQGELGEETLIQHWSSKYNTTILSSNYGSGEDILPPNDCSGIIVNGTVLEMEKYSLQLQSRPGADGENILLATIPIY